MGGQLLASTISARDRCLRAAATSWHHLPDHGGIRLRHAGVSMKTTPGRRLVNRPGMRCSVGGVEGDIALCCPTRRVTRRGISRRSAPEIANEAERNTLFSSVSSFPLGAHRQLKRAGRSVHSTMGKGRRPQLCPCLRQRRRRCGSVSPRPSKDAPHTKPQPVAFRPSPGKKREIGKGKISQVFRQARLFRRRRRANLAGIVAPLRADRTSGWQNS